jgi:hypothetical protein
MHRITAIFLSLEISHWEYGVAGSDDSLLERRHLGAKQNEKIWTRGRIISAGSLLRHGLVADDDPCKRCQFKRSMQHHLVY